MTQRQHSTSSHNQQHTQQSQQHHHQDIHMNAMLSSPNAVVPVAGQAIPQGHANLLHAGGIISGNPQSSQQAYINFNLSTICPEINAAFVPHITDKLGLLPPGPQPPTVAPLTHPSIAAQPTSTSAVSISMTKTSSVRQNSSNTGSGISVTQSSQSLLSGSTGTSTGVSSNHESLPHSIAILGQGIPQVGLGTVGFSTGITSSANMIAPSSGSMNFALNDQ